MNVKKDERNNIIYGAEYIPENSKVNFVGTGNILYLESGVYLENAILNFNGSDSIIYIRGGNHKLNLNVSINNQCTFAMGRNNYLNGRLNVIVSEQTNVCLGDNCVISFGIWIRTADPHLIYDVSNHKRINPSKSVIIGDHVWIGQGALVLKGTYIGSGAIIGAASVVSGKKIPSNTVYAGNPVREVKKNVFWDGACVHSWTQTQTKKYEKYDENKWVFLDDRESIEPEQLQNQLRNALDAEARLAVIRNIYEEKERSNSRFCIVEKQNSKESIIGRMFKKS